MKKSLLRYPTDGFLGDLTKKSKSDMLKVRNLGLKSIEEVVAKLQTYGLGLRNDEE